MKLGSLLLVFTSVFMTTSFCQADTVKFDGLDWQVRQDFGGPGPNHWSKSLVRVDKRGRLHLRVDKVDGVWCSAELYLTKPMGFGLYAFHVEGPIDHLDKNVVLGLFNYTTPDIGPDGTNEIDIELAHWGVQKYPPVNFTVYPSIVRPGSGHKEFVYPAAISNSYFAFEWSATAVAFGAYAKPAEKPYIAWTFLPENEPTLQVPQKPIPVHINFWLFRGKAPSDGKPEEVIIDSFKFTPHGPPVAGGAN
jgi:hypothetical protein